MTQFATAESQDRVPAFPPRPAPSVRLRPFCVSLKRCCPRCRDKAVLKHRLFRYYCNRCGLEFIGFRAVFFRLALGSDRRRHPRPGRGQPPTQ